MSVVSFQLSSLPQTLAEIQALPRFTHVVQTGIYFLFDEGAIVYVGQGVDIHQRVAYHSGAEQKQFDSYAYLPYLASQLNEAEAYFIHLLQPYYNRTIPSNSNFKSIHSIKKMFGLGMNVLKRFMQHHRIPLTQATYNVTDFAELNQFIDWMKVKHPNVNLKQCQTYCWNQYLKEPAG